MKSLLQSFRQPLQAVPTKTFLFLLIVALFGFADASYLTIEHYQNAIPPCSVGSCELVLTSAYANVLGMPVSLYGALFYLIFLIGAFAYLEGKREKALRFALVVSLPAGIAALVFIALMVFVIRAWCIYCLTSDILTIIIALSAWRIFAKYTQKGN